MVCRSAFRARSKAEPLSTVKQSESERQPGHTMIERITDAQQAGTVTVRVTANRVTMVPPKRAGLTAPHTEYAKQARRSGSTCP